jgi:biopolymer transport protein ExbD
MAEYTAQRVRSRARAAVRKREDQIETEEMEGGEINLIPYLDIVTNLMLFILATVSGLILSQIDTTLPDKADKPPATNVTQPDQNPEDKPLGLFVSINRKEMILWSLSRLEGTLKQPKAIFPVAPPGSTAGQACEGPYNCESNLCEKGVCVANPEEVAQPVYPYHKLNDALFEIAQRRYAQPAGKLRKRDTYTIVLQADGTIPYSVITATMSAMRCKFPDPNQPLVGCRFPNEDPIFKESGEALSKDGRYFNTEKAPYDPKTMALFPQIQFSSGFE